MGRMGDIARQVRCEACGRVVTIKPEHAMRRMKCPCGAVVSEPPPASIAMTGTDAPVARPVHRADFDKLPGARRSVQPVAQDRSELGTMRHWVLPLTALLVGILGRVAQIVVVVRTHEFTVPSVTIVVAAEFLFAMIGVVGAYLLCQKIFDLDPEEPVPTLLKLAAIVSVAGVVQFFGGYITRGPFSSGDVYVGLPLSWVASALLVSLFFGYIAWDAWRVGAFLYIMRIVAVIGVLGSIGPTRGRSILLGM